MIDRVNSLSSPGGDTVQIHAIAEYLSSLGHDVRITLQIEDELTTDLVILFNLTRPYDLIVQYNALVSKKKIPYLIFPIYWNLDKVIPSEHKDTSLRYLPTWFKNFLRASVFVIRHVRWIIKYRIPLSAFYMRTKTMMNILQNSICICPNSQSEAVELMSEYGTNLKNKIKVILNGTAFNEFDINQSEFPDIPFKHYVCCVGNIGPRKNQLNLVKAAMKENVNLVLVGDATPENKWYLDRLKKIAGPNIYFAGRRKKEDVLKIIQHSYGHIQPSFIETPGLSSLEAAVLGKNIVVSDVGPPREYFGEYAIYCNPYSVESIAGALCELERRSEGTRNIELSEYVMRNFAWDVALKDLKTILREFQETREK